MKPMTQEQWIARLQEEYQAQRLREQRKQESKQQWALLVALMTGLAVGMVVGWGAVEAIRWAADWGKM